ncbi:hypothetical protein OCU04_011048 [Sclerotinia nivalis]|uniref:Uncharacterized protein n=1 Tax=Sclerotinia nivalis TaxID=352851 RepID=A0A9X0AE82_9HELO|nr:hypothetical protein OCU04_011048 [Sclerotinia nivalis]
MSGNADSQPTIAMSETSKKRPRDSSEPKSPRKSNKRRNGVVKSTCGQPGFSRPHHFNPTILAMNTKLTHVVLVDREYPTPPLRNSVPNVSLAFETEKCHTPESQEHILHGVMETIMSSLKQWSARNFLGIYPLQNPSTPPLKTLCLRLKDIDIDPSMLVSDRNQWEVHDVDVLLQSLDEVLQFDQTIINNGRISRAVLDAIFENGFAIVRRLGDEDDLTEIKRLCRLQIDHCDQKLKELENRLRKARDRLDAQLIEVDELWDSLLGMARGKNPE